MFTLMKASVYSIVLQQEIDWGGPAAGENGGGGSGGDGPGGAGSGVGEQL